MLVAEKCWTVYQCTAMSIILGDTANWVGTKADNNIRGNMPRTFALHERENKQSDWLSAADYCIATEESLCQAKQEADRYQPSIRAASHLANLQERTVEHSRSNGTVTAAGRKQCHRDWPVDGEQNCRTGDILLTLTWAHLGLLTLRTARSIGGILISLISK